MNIGEVAKAAELPAKTIRYYEDIGLVRPDRDSNGYRNFGERDPVSYTHLTLPTIVRECRSRWSPYH